jgi:glutaconate CoA-transferase subunit A
MNNLVQASVDSLVANSPAGAKLAVPVDYSGVAMSATLALIRRGVRNLHLVTVPASGLQSELLIGAGCVATLETSAITLGEFGPAPRFVDAVKQGNIQLLDATCPAIHAAIQAAQKGLPFIPLRGLVGSDIMSVRKDWKIIDNPFAADDPIVVLPAIAPDFALFHAPLADVDGNVWVGRRRELVTMAQASRQTLVTVEEIRETSLFEDEALAAGTIPALYVSGVARAERGAWPLPLWDYYGTDENFLQRYVTSARTQAGFDAFLNDWLSQTSVAAE